MVPNLAVYWVFGQANVTAASGAGDLIGITTPADALITPIGAYVQKDTDEGSEQVACKLSWRATVGSGGTSVTPEPAHSHLIASQCTARRNDTTDASGAERMVSQEAQNLIGDGWRWSWEEVWKTGRISEHLVLHLLDALAADSDLTFAVGYIEQGQ